MLCAVRHLHHVGDASTKQEPWRSICQCLATMKYSSRRALYCPLHVERKVVGVILHECVSPENARPELKGPRPSDVCPILQPSETAAAHQLHKERDIERS
uniref:Uncharacterized protein n=1 Tax=Timema poppense TaxID=170557 RepID=A0A7R9H9H5_TIMPO|nr:unnamed protein product [Timema poppensis]